MGRTTPADRLERILVLADRLLGDVHLSGASGDRIAELSNEARAALTAIEVEHVARALGVALDLEERLPRPVEDEEHSVRHDRRREFRSHAEEIEHVRREHDLAELEARAERTIEPVDRLRRLRALDRTPNVQAAIDAERAELGLAPESAPIEF
jgi:hypothetical protein